HNSVIGSYCQQ
ncbi:hypothetical protein ACN38_g11228, partial [Penicillium nordicum]